MKCLSLPRYHSRSNVPIKVSLALTASKNSVRSNATPSSRMYMKSKPISSWLSQAWPASSSARSSCFHRTTLYKTSALSVGNRCAHPIVSRPPIQQSWFVWFSQARPATPGTSWKLASTWRFASRGTATWLITSNAASSWIKTWSWSKRRSRIWSRGIQSERQSSSASTGETTVDSMSTNRVCLTRSTRMKMANMKTRQGSIMCITHCASTALAHLMILSWSRYIKSTSDRSIRRKFSSTSSKIKSWSASTGTMHCKNKCKWWQCWTCKVKL